MRIRVTQRMFADISGVVSRRDMASTTITDVFCRSLRKYWRCDYAQRENALRYGMEANGTTDVKDVPLKVSVPKSLISDLNHERIRAIVRWYVDHQVNIASTEPFRTEAVAGKDYLITE